MLLFVAGGGYLADAFGTILIPDYALSIGTVTFVGEALLIVWLFARAIKGFPSDREVVPSGDTGQALQPSPSRP